MDTKIEIIKLIPWAGSIIVAVAIGMYSLTKYLNKQVIDALLQRIQSKDERLEELSSTIKTLELKEQQQNPEHNKDLILPETTKGKLPIELVNKYERKQQELHEIIIIIQNENENIFEPNSEISNLATMLKQGDQETRKQGVQGLLELRDENVTTLLLTYFFLHEEEATKGYLPSIGEWIRHFDSIKKDTAISFCINLIKNGENFNARCAYEWLLNNNTSSNNCCDDMQPYMNELKAIAINHNDTLRRTWAKKLLEIYEFLLEHKDINIESRGLYQLVSDIEEYLKKALPLKTE